MVQFDIAQPSSEIAENGESTAPLFSLSRSLRTWQIASIIVSILLFVHVILSVLALCSGAGAFVFSTFTKESNSVLWTTTLGFVLCHGVLHILYIFAGLIGIFKFFVNQKSPRSELQLDTVFLGQLLVAHICCWFMLAMWSILGTYFDQTDPVQLAAYAAMKKVMGTSGLLQLVFVVPALLVSVFKLRATNRLRELVQGMLTQNRQNMLDKALERVKTARASAEMQAIEMEIFGANANGTAIWHQICTSRALSLVPGVPTIQGWITRIGVNLIVLAVYVASCVLIILAALFFILQVLAPAAVSITRATAAIIFCVGMITLFVTGILLFVADCTDFAALEKGFKRDPMVILPLLCGSLFACGCLFLAVASVLSLFPDKASQTAQGILFMCGSPLILTASIMRIGVAIDAAILTFSLPSSLPHGLRFSIKFQTITSIISSIIFTSGALVLNVSRALSSPDKDTQVAGFVLLVIVFSCFLISTEFLVAQVLVSESVAVKRMLDFIRQGSDKKPVPTRTRNEQAVSVSPKS